MKQTLKRLSFVLCISAVANITLQITFFSLYHHTYWSIPINLILILYWLLINILPYPHKSDASPRLTILMGGRTLCYTALYSFLVQALIFLFLYPVLLRQPALRQSLWLNAGLSILLIFLPLWNGMLRVFLLSQRLRLKTRLIMLFCMWIPGLNLGALLYALRKVHAEYDYGCYQASIRQLRVTSDLCQTKYPLLLVHGVGFRDLRYFNYWGRIPRELTRYGATIHYGNQEAFGTIIYNAHDIKDKIIEITKATGLPKVNIIAHSKGGLDARYAISQLGADQYVASLTTLNTPHHGCRFVDYACQLPEGLYRFIARIFDRTFARFGDQNPDFYTATRQFSTQTSHEFNQLVIDSPNVYYQSYTSIMKHCFSDPLLALPYCLIYPLEGANDGLVSISSAKWGEFKGVITNQRQRGVSHADIIDLKREDYQGFDVIETLVQVVAQLKEQGY